MENDSIQSKGGKARAKVLSAGERKEIARNAATSRWNAEQKILNATHAGTLRIGELEIQCAVLEDGTRVLTQKTFLQAIGRTHPRGGETEKAIDGLPFFLSSPRLIPFISKDLRRSVNPVFFRALRGGGRQTIQGGKGGKGYAVGFDAHLLPQVCKLFLEARDRGVLSQAEVRIAAKCDLLLRGLATVGIIALVDEATGFQEVRDRRALEAILDAFLLKEFAAWAKRFPDEFYKQIFRLRNWQWKGMTVNRPQIVSNYTKDLVYARLAPGILKELESRNPIEDGRRQAKHHQWLTGDIGHPALAAHIYAVIGLMRISDDWGHFKKLLERAYPKRGDTLQLPLFKDDLVSSTPPLPSSQLAFALTPKD
jgi:hypothetical protein